MKDVLGKSGLPNNDLAKIWVLADYDKSGALSVVQFCIAMQLVMLRKREKMAIFPVSVPRNIIMQVEQTLNAQQNNAQASPGPQRGAVRSSPWRVDPKRLPAILDTFEKNQSGGYVTGQQAYQLFVASKLDRDDLRKIWALSDRTNSGRLSKAEFVIAIQLINVKLRGMDLPDSIPLELLESVPEYGHSPVQPVSRNDVLVMLFYLY